MGCLKGYVRRIGAINALAKRISESLSVDVVPSEFLSVAVESLSHPIVPSLRLSTKPLGLSVVDSTPHLNLACDVVCSLEKATWLRVTPEEVQWITDDIGVFYDVESNTSWTVTY